MFLMVWKLFEQNVYQFEWYKLSVERIHCQRDFRGSGFSSLNACIFDTDLSLVFYMGTPLTSSLGSSLPCDRMVEGGISACSGSGSPILIF